MASETLFFRDETESLNGARVHTAADPRQSVSSLDAQQTSSNEAQNASLAFGEIPSVPEKRLVHMKPVAGSVQVPLAAGVAFGAQDWPLILL